MTKGGDKHLGAPPPPPPPPPPDPETTQTHNNSSIEIQRVFVFSWVIKSDIDTDTHTHTQTHTHTDTHTDTHRHTHTDTDTDTHTHTDTHRHTHNGLPHWDKRLDISGVSNRQKRDKKYLHILQVSSLYSRIHIVTKIYWLSICEISKKLNFKVNRNWKTLISFCFLSS
jgi:hypothetical protein